MRKCSHEILSQYNTTATEKLWVQVADKKKLGLYQNNYYEQIAEKWRQLPGFLLFIYRRDTK